jgi:hypothetical protein
MSASTSHISNFLRSFSVVSMSGGRQRPKVCGITMCKRQVSLDISELSRALIASLRAPTRQLEQQNPSSKH